MLSIPVDQRRIRGWVRFLQELPAHREKALKRPPRPLKRGLRFLRGKRLRYRASRNPGLRRERYWTHYFEGLLQPTHVTVGSVPRVPGRHKPGREVAE